MDWKETVMRVETIMTPTKYEAIKGSLIRQAIDKGILDPTEYEIAKSVAEISFKAGYEALKAEYDKDMEQHKLVGIREAISVYEPYVELLGQEIDTLSPLAIAHGWRSVRVKAGKKCREEIAKLKEVAKESKGINA